MHDFRKRFPVFSTLAALILATSLPSQAADEGADTAAAHLLRAETALHGDDYLQAVTEYRKAAELSDSVEIARQATRLAFDFGFNDDAVRAASRWRELDPDSDEALIFLARAQLRQGDSRAARRNFKVLVERGEHPADQQIFSLMGVIAQEDPQQTDELMRALAKPYPDSALANYAMAAAALQADDLEFARERVERAIELDPDWMRP
jgi:tetratricopeptide (TPR) repeat protein